MAANSVAIRALRTGRHCSLRQFARQTGISPGFLSQIENGKRDASMKTLERIALEFNVPVEALIIAEPVVSAK